MAKKNEEKKVIKPTGKVTKPNISQAGIIKALKARGFTQKTDVSPYEFIQPKTNRKVIVHADKTVVPGTNVSVPLGKGAIIEFMKQIESL